MITKKLIKLIIICFFLLTLNGTASADITLGCPGDGNFDNRSPLFCVKGFDGYTGPMTIFINNSPQFNGNLNWQMSLQKPNEYILNDLEYRFYSKYKGIVLPEGKYYWKARDASNRESNSSSFTAIAAFIEVSHSELTFVVNAGENELPPQTFSVSMQGNQQYGLLRVQMFYDDSPRFFSSSFRSISSWISEGREYTVKPIVAGLPPGTYTSGYLFTGFLYGWSNQMVWAESNPFVTLKLIINPAQSSSLPSKERRKLIVASSYHKKVCKKNKKYHAKHCKVSSKLRKHKKYKKLVKVANLRNKKKCTKIVAR